MPRFEIEQILVLDAGVAVLARRQGASDFTITSSSTLGGVPLREHLDIPRKLLPDGSPDLEFFAFQLAHREDASKLAVGQVADLVP